MDRVVMLSDRRKDWCTEMAVERGRNDEGRERKGKMYMKKNAWVERKEE